MKLLYFSERCIARYKADHPAGSKEDVVICTKFLPLPYKLSYPSSLINALRASLERLKVYNNFRCFDSALNETY
jgi:aryl-alcohol dehydrogenase-like predicted oxidoreductase